MRAIYFESASAVTNKLMVIWMREYIRLYKEHGHYGDRAYLNSLKAYGVELGSVLPRMKQTPYEEFKQALRDFDFRWRVIDHEHARTFGGKAPADRDSLFGNYKHPEKHSNNQEARVAAWRQEYHRDMLPVLMLPTPLTL